MTNSKPHIQTQTHIHLMMLYLFSTQSCHFTLDYSWIHPSSHLSLSLDELISLPLPVVWVTLTTQENLLTGSSCPSGLISPQLPVRHDQYVIPSVTRPCSFATSSFPATLYFHFIIISHSRSMQANRLTVNHTTIRAASNHLVDSSSLSTASKWNINDNET